MSLRDFSQAMMEKLQSSATVRVVYGDPVEAQGKTVIPVAKVVYGFGGGLGPGRLRTENADRASLGEGGGGGVAATPVGVIEISDEGTRFVPVDDLPKMLMMAGAGLLIGLLLARR
jgi:uncharacterized spore protein YtfJ